MEQFEDTRVAGLLDAQIKAQRLFDEVEELGLIRPGTSETEINESIYTLAQRMYGITATGTNESCEPAETPCSLTRRTHPT
jgi:hypothetical protein